MVLMSEQNAANAAQITKISAQSEAMAETFKVLKENISALALNNESTAEKMRDELVAVKSALEKLTGVLNAEVDDLKKAAESSPSATKKFMATPTTKR